MHRFKFKSDAMKTRILEKGTQLFFRFGVKTVTMDSIASELGISKKTIYQYFQDKDSIVFDVVQRFLEEDKKKWDMLDAKYSNVIQKMFASMEVMKDMLKEMNPRILFEIQKYHPKAFALFQSYQDEHISKKISGDFTLGIQSGYFRADVDVMFLTKLRMAEIDLGFHPDFYPENKLSLYDTQRVLSDIFMRGILTETGLTFYNSYQNK